jgi:hypothetical protein
VVAKFDQQHASSDGGALLLQACDQRLGLTEALIGGIDDRRQSGKIRHAVGDLVRQRLYAIACGYPLLRLLPAGATVAGWASHPLEDRAFARRTECSS